MAVTKEEIIKLIDVLSHVSYEEALEYLVLTYQRGTITPKEIYDLYQDGLEVLKEKVSELEWQ